MNTRRLRINQLEAKLKGFVVLRNVSVPARGWLHAIRTGLGMSLQQLADRLGISRQAAQGIELREMSGSVSLNSLRQAANALDMDLVYGFVPRDGSLDALIERKARELAEQIVARTATSMSLEAQGNTDERLQQAIEERTQDLKYQLPKMLWN